MKKELLLCVDLNKYSAPSVCEGMRIEIKISKWNDMKNQEGRNETNKAVTNDYLKKK